MEKKEKRAATRIQVPLTGVITVKTEGAGVKLIEVGAKDVSENGAYLWAGTSPRVGDKIRINLSCSSEVKQLKISLQAEGLVMRVDQLQKRKCGFAVQFREGPELDEEAG